MALITIFRSKAPSFKRLRPNLSGRRYRTANPLVSQKIVELVEDGKIHLQKWIYG